MVRTGEDGPKGISVPGGSRRGMPGLSFGKKERKMGLETASPTAQVLFDNWPCVPGREPHRRGGRGLPHRDGGAGRWPPINIGACSVGTARAALEESVAVRQRIAKQFGRPVGEFQASQFKLRGTWRRSLEASRLMDPARRRRRSTGAIPRATMLCAMAKRFCDRYRLQDRQRRAAIARRLWLPEGLPGGAACA